MRRCLVTGGAGFIGSHLVEALCRRGDEVRVLDNFSTGRRENLAGLEQSITLIEADLNDRSALEEAVKGVELVFHLAALPSVPRSVADPVGANRANVDATVGLLWQARQAGVRRVVYAASSSAYGNNPHFPRDETAVPDPISPYAASKLAGEFYCHAFWECYGLETVSLRHFNVFGPRQDPTSQYAAAIPIFITAMVEDRPPTVFGDGEQSRDFTYVENTVQANLLAAEAPEACGRVFNVGTGCAVTVNDVIAAINRILGKEVRALFAPPRPGDVRHSLADISLARKYLGYEPAVAFEEGLRKTMEFFRGAGRVPLRRNQRTA
jgi:UDP-glucose 4-epimerase